MTATGEDSPTRSRVRPILMILAICAAIGVVAVAVRRAEADHRARFATLPDGSTVELLGTAVGGAGFTTETRWQRLARRVLPSRFQRWLPPISVTHFTPGSNSGAVYLRLTNPSLSAGGPLPWAGYELADDAGFCYPGDGPERPWSFYSTGSVVCRFPLCSYPRRQREFFFHLLDYDGETIAAFRVPNPAPGSFPDWRPEPLPQTKINGPVTLTLQSMAMKKYGAHRYLKPEFRVGTSAPAWVKAEARLLTLSDATGNQTDRLLSPNEPAWKLRALVYRQRPEDFAANEQLVLTNVPLPSANRVCSLNQSADCAGVGLKVLSVADAGTYVVNHGVTTSMLPASQGAGDSSTFMDFAASPLETSGSSTVCLLIEARNTQPDDKIQIHVRDDSEGEVRVEMRGCEQTTDGVRIYKPTFAPPDGARTVTVTVLVNRPLAFDFLVDPADVRTW